MTHDHSGEGGRRPVTTTSTAHSASCSIAPRTSPVSPPIARMAKEHDHRRGDERGGDERAGPPPGRERGDRDGEEPGEGGAPGGDRPGVAGTEPVGLGERDDNHRHDGDAAGQAVGGDQTGEGVRRTQRADGDDPHDDRTAQRGDAVAAVARVVEDLQPPLARPAAGEGVGGVGEPVLVEGAGEGDPEQHGDRGGDRHRHQLPEPGGDPADGGTDQRADHREPRHGPRELTGAAGTDRDPGEELDGGDEPAGRTAAGSHPSTPHGSSRRNARPATTNSVVSAAAATIWFARPRRSR